MVRRFIGYQEIQTFFAKRNGRIGFKNLASNKAVMSKACWWVLKWRNSLEVRVLKMKYFPDKEFLDINEQYGGSYSWKSLCWAKELILKGLR